MIRSLLAVIATAMVVLLCPNALLAQSDIVIDIYESGTAKIKIGVPPFMKDPASQYIAEPGIGEEIAQVIRDDLDFSGLFRVHEWVPPAGESGHDPTAFPPLKDWIPLGVQSVVQGSYRRAGDKLSFECTLLDVESESRIVGRSYRGSPRDVRMVAHTFADEIVYRYTGRRGVARTALAYVKAKGDAREIHIMDYDGRNSYQLTYDGSIAISPAWSPDGSKIAFTSYKEHNPDIYIVSLLEKSYTRVSGYIGLNTTPAFSPDGTTLALTLSKDGNPELYLLRIKDGSLTRLTRNSRIDTSPAWSPNGRELAFVSDRSGQPQIYIIDREAIDLRRLTYSGYNNTSPAWSPEGDKIAYVSMVAGRGEIFTISPTGANAVRLTFNGGNEDPSWSPDGRYLAYTSRVGHDKDIYLMRADGSGKKRITFGGGDSMSPAWSP